MVIFDGHYIDISSKIFENQNKVLDVPVNFCVVIENDLENNFALYRSIPVIFTSTSEHSITSSKTSTMACKAEIFPASNNSFSGYFCKLTKGSDVYKFNCIEFSILSPSLLFEAAPFSSKVKDMVFEYIRVSSYDDMTF